MMRASRVPEHHIEYAIGGAVSVEPLNESHGRTNLIVKFSLIEKAVFTHFLHAMAFSTPCLLNATHIPAFKPVLF
jgi:hypothetical protein